MVQLSKWQMALVGIVVLIGALFAAPNVTGPSGVPGLPQKPVTLGLDLQGGAYLLLEVEVGNAREEYLTGLKTQISREMLSERIRTSRPIIENGVLSFRISKAEDFDSAGRIVRQRSGDASVESDQASRTYRLSMSEAALASYVESTVTRTVEVVRRRVDGFGLTEPSIQRQGDTRIVLQLPGVGDVESIKSGLLKTAKMEFRMVSEVSAAQSLDVENVAYAEGAGFGFESELPLEIDAPVTGACLQEAGWQFDPQNNTPVVTFRFDGRCAGIFAELTSQNTGRRFAIVLDGEIISAPTIRSAIIGGAGIIEGGFSAQSASELAVLLNAGALPAPLNFIEERTVGPSMGADSIQAGLMACILGLAFVLVFMALYYGIFGLFANIALVANLVILLGALTGLGATLTLPGIAGIVLTVGMAVDANVLIYERMREVMNSGTAKSVGDAIKKGYAQALSTILDANFTTLIAAILLFIFGSGPIKGFAVTLSIGILTSMFCALLLTRMLIGFWWSPKRQNLPIA